jgi:hypothetical protein
MERWVPLTYVKSHAVLPHRNQHQRETLENMHAPVDDGASLPTGLAPVGTPKNLALVRKGLMPDNPNIPATYRPARLRGGKKPRLVRREADWIFYSRDTAHYVGMSRYVPKFFRRETMIQAVDLMQGAADPALP